MIVKSFLLRSEGHSQLRFSLNDLKCEVEAWQGSGLISFCNQGKVLGRAPSWSLFSVRSDDSVASPWSLMICSLETVDSLYHRASVPSQTPVATRYLVPPLLLCIPVCAESFAPSQHALNFHLILPFQIAAHFPYAGSSVLDSRDLVSGGVCRYGESRPG